MNADRLLAHYERIADAPDAIARLRRFILDLAVRGKLVSQDPNDEPASELLKRIAAEKARLVKAGQIKKTSLENPISSNNTPFSLTDGWAWSTLGWICSKTGSGSTPRGGKKAYKSSGVVFLRSQNVHDDGLRLSDAAYIDRATHERMSGTAIETSDLLLNITGGSIGRCCLVPDGLGEANISQHVAIIRAVIDGPQQFMRCLVLSPYFQAFISNEQTGAGRGGLPKNKMDRIPIPLPPLAEQHRIVAKVDELMALCDRMEAARTEREATRDRLAAASLIRLNDPDPDPVVFRKHAAFAIENLAPLTTRRDQIKALRQTILNLAVRGKLLEQDPNDEPAAELLKRIAKEKAGESKKTKPTISLTSSITRCDVPSGWVITDLQSVCASITDGDHLPPPKTESGIPFLVIGNVRSQTIEFTGSRFVSPEYYEVLDPIRRPRSGDLLYTLVGSYGIPVVVRDNQPFCVQRHIGILRPSNFIDVGFLARAMESRLVFEQATACATGIAQKTVPLSGLRRLLIPIPPLAEQHRIVTRADELIALCDRLEASLSTGDDTRRRLLDALLHEVLVMGADRKSVA